MVKNVTSSKRRWGTVIIVFCITFGLYLANLPHDYSKNLRQHNHRRLLTTRDTVSNIFLPYLLLKEGTLDFSNYIDKITKYIPGSDYYVIEINGGLYPKYPIFTGLMATPIYAPVILLNKIPNLNTLLNVYKVLLLGRITAAFYASGAVALFYLILKNLQEKTTTNINNIFLYLFLFAYAFGTNTWTISSRSLWQHTSSQLLITLTIYLLFKGLKDARWVPITGLLLGLTVLARPTNIVFALPMAIYVLIKHRNKFQQFFLWGLPTVALYFMQNKLLYGGFFLEGYQLGDDLTFNTPLIHGIMGLLYSPGKGFLFTMPIQFLGIIQIIKHFFKRHEKDLDYLLTAMGVSFILGFLLISKWRGWDGADRFGPGLLTEFVPIISIFSFFFFDKLLNWKPKFTLILFILLMTYSFYVHFNATVFRKSRCTSKHNWTFYCLAPPKRWPKY